MVVYQPECPPRADRRSRESKLDEFVRRMSEELALDQLQRDRFRTVLIESRDLFREAHREANRSAGKETREKLRSVLRSDQLEKFDDLIERIPSRHPLGRESRGQR